jgi:hypothetical protein
VLERLQAVMGKRLPVFDMAFVYVYLGDSNVRQGFIVGLPLPPRELYRSLMDWI